MYRIVLACYDVPVTAGEKAADDITHEFGQHRKWHSNVICSWDGNCVLSCELTTILTLTAH
jgi:hypothetical protein